MEPAIPPTVYDGNPIALFEPTFECCANLGERIYSEDPKVNLGGVAWAKATYNTADDSMRLPDLDLYRVHLWGTSQLGPDWSGTFRLHAGTAPGVLSRYNQDGTIFVYQAFLDRKHLFSDSDKVTLGLATNAYLKRLYRLHGTRFISRLLSQRIGYLTPTPLGVRYELTTPSLQSAITLETTAVRPDMPTTHLVGAGSTLHWNPASPWTLSAHATYRHRSNASAAAPSEAVFASAITYQNTHLTLSAEVVGRLLIESTNDTELGGGLLGQIQALSVTSSLRAVHRRQSSVPGCLGPTIYLANRAPAPSRGQLDGCTHRRC